MNSTDAGFMQAAIEEARRGRDEGGVPIGAALVLDGVIVGRGHNRRVQEQSPILHAEIDCLRAAGRVGRFHESVLYSTLMPCYMCAGAVLQFGIPRVVVGESVTFPGAAALMRQHGVDVVDLDLEACKAMMRAFIAEKPELWSEDIGVRMTGGTIPRRGTGPPKSND